MNTSEEYLKCQLDFCYFAKNHVLINSQKDLVQMTVEPMHERLAEFLNTENFGIVKKFRQGGFTTLCAVYGLWRAMFYNEQRILLMSSTGKDSKDVSKIIKLAIANMPEDLKPILTSNTELSINFNNNSSIFTLPAYSYRYTKHFDLIFMDEVSLWSEPTKRWKEIISMRSDVGKIFLVSSPGFKKNWFWKQYQKCVDNMNDFKEFKCNYKEMSFYEDEIKMDMYKEIIGYNAFRHEFEAEFLSDQTPMEINCEILETF